MRCPVCGGPLKWDEDHEFADETGFVAGCCGSNIFYHKGHPTLTCVEMDCVDDEPSVVELHQAGLLTEHQMQTRLLHLR